jgi:hypothetical protein
VTSKDLFIHHIQQVEVGGSKNIPTTVFYETETSCCIGYEAIEATEDVLAVNQDFKLDLGRHDSSSPRQNLRFPTAAGSEKSAYVISQDFITKILAKVSFWLDTHQVEEAAHILIAEPLAMHAENDSRWLENYRRNLREMLSGKRSEEFPNIRFDEVSFLPEPFAVFQYYRYGINHPAMVQAIKQQALIVDFGGGTFDVCIVETTKEGDISQAGRNSKPYGASSIQVGGFFLNRKIAEYLYRNYLDKTQRDRFKQGLKEYHRWRRNERDLSTMRDDIREFVLNFHRTSFEIEAPKIALCKDIRDWRLEAPLHGQTRVRLPINPFAEDSASQSVPFSATELRNIFLESIWAAELAPSIKLCFERAAEDLHTQPVTIVLLSGGSANIGWLEEALFRDFQSQLRLAQPLRLPDFQEVVAKGLSVECARRFYVETGDFGSVVYNRLCLMLDVHKSADSSDCRPRPFRAVTVGVPTADQPGVLLESASSIRSFIDVPIRWKVGQVGAQPKRLDYYFLRSSLDPDDLDNRLNFEEVTALAPKEARFDQELKIELTVREDGTALPRFIYHAGRDESDSIATRAKPFALDVTYRATAPGAKAYIGFDFGTSNSSISFVESRSIREYKARLGESSWKELNDLAYRLPYPITDSLLAYLSETTNKERLNNAARQAFEAMLATTFYAVLTDYRLYRQEKNVRKHSKLFGQLSQRSAGPLWASLRQLFVEQGFAKHATFTSVIGDLFSGDIYRVVDEFVSFIGDAKHEKVEIGTIDLHRPLYALANVCHSLFSTARFGFFEDLRRSAFKENIQGWFRVAHGQPPFITTFEVSLDILVPEIMPYLLLLESNIALPMSPMVFWWQDPKAHLFEHGCCYIFDIADRANTSFSFKAIGSRDHRKVTLEDHELGEFAKQIAAERESDGPIEVAKVRRSVLD